MLPGLLLLYTLLRVYTATARPASQTVFAADASFSPLDDSHHSSSFSPLLPPAIPLAVKSPYLNALLPTGGEGGSTGYLAGSWARHWPVHYPGSPRDYRLSWAGLIRIDGTTYEFFGAPLSDSKSSLGPARVARQTAFEYTATKSVFSFEAGNVTFKATFLSPITPNDLVRQSLPLSYLAIDVDPDAARDHSISVYTDISGEWASGDPNANLTWTYTSGSGVGVHAVSRRDQLVFSEFAEQAEWGEAVLATELRRETVGGSGEANELRGTFIKHGRLNGTHDAAYRKMTDRQPVFGFSVQITSSRPSAVFTIGHVRHPYVNFVTPEGQIPLAGLWTTRFSRPLDAISYFQYSYPRTSREAARFDKQVRRDVKRVSGDNYAALVELSTRQAFATFELTTSVTEDWREDKEGVMAHLKEISSNGDMSTIDVIFPLHPILLYTNPTLLALLLEPILVYTHSGLYPNRWPVHDLGTYPNATGYNDGNDEPMPVEEAGNMLWMALAYFQLTGDKPWVEKHYEIFKSWTTFLTDDGLVPAEQLSTDDFAGTLSNQTNLAVKAIVGIGAMSELAKGVGRWTDGIHYRAVAEAYVREWTALAMTETGGARHAKLAYQDDGSWGTLYNLFGDRLLHLQLFDRQLYKDQSAWYAGKAQKYGVPLDSRHLWTKTDWEVFAAGSATDKKGRELFIDLLVDYLKAGKVDATFPDLYETTTANFPGRDGLDWPIYFISRPVVGGHFALLALEKANGANGVEEDPFGG
ncbi:hypothetical protein JCM10296v2_003189 [Rhodotorula toruloides]